MDALFDIAMGSGAGAKLLVAAFVFIPTATIAFLVMAGVRVRGAVRRRAAGISGDMVGSSGSGLRTSGMKARASATPNSRCVLTAVNVSRLSLSCRPRPRALSCATAAAPQAG